MRLLKKILAITIVIISFYYNVQASTCDSLSQIMMEQTWKEFRAIHPFSFQTVGLKHFGDTSVYVMSEPPYWVSPDNIKELFLAYGGHMGIGKHVWGYDGVLTDAIGCVILEYKNKAEFESRLFKLLYRTDYKPYYTNLDNPIPHAYYSLDTLNFFVNNKVLYEIEKAPIFIGHHPFLSKNDTTCIKCWLSNQSASCKIFYSEKPGLLAWTIPLYYIPHINEIEDSVFLSNARKFLLDTDLIVGAIPHENGSVAFIGHERQIPINILPPLRAEAIQLLKQYVTDTLFVRFCADSVKCVDNKTYATPIKMNECLKHSELGNLMVLATELLMSYTTDNQINDYFIADYPLPRESATFEKANVYSSRWYPNFDECFHSYAIGNANCMFPVLYEQKDDVDLPMEIESDNAYEYFVNQKNIDLIRANQYAFIHHVFNMQIQNIPIPEWKELLKQHQLLLNGQLPSIPSVVAPSKNKWIKSPSTIITNAPIKNSDFVIQ